MPDEYVAQVLVGVGLVIVGFWAVVGCVEVLRWLWGRRAGEQPMPERGIAEELGPAEITFTMEGVENPILVDEFFERFNDAVVATSYLDDVVKGDVRISFRVSRCAIPDWLKDDLEKAGFVVMDQPQK